ncbi:MAG: site-specific integrase [Rikenellaceae bacterium]
MATTKFYLDCRATRSNGTAPLKVTITNKTQSSLIGLDVFITPAQWDKSSGRIVNHPNKSFLNTYITRRKLDIETELLKLSATGLLSQLGITEIRNLILQALNPCEPKKHTFVSEFTKFIGSKEKQRTREIYQMTLNWILKFDTKAELLTFEEITKDWLVDFDKFVSTTSPSRNARNIHLRNIRAVFNTAIDNEITTAYPFRKFKIRSEATIKRSLSIEQLRELLSMQVDKTQEKYLDIFKLIFYFIGINIVDLCSLKQVTNGRIEYYRAKTNRLYSIKVEPEAMEIIDKYRGVDFLLNPLDRYKTYRDYAKRLNDNLQLVGPISHEYRVVNGKRRKHKKYNPIHPELTTYWARHSWATIAAELDIPKETIAAALGHGGNTVTDIYINFDQHKVDEANRKVIDYVLNL